MAGSAADAISHAVERSKQLLFPVKSAKWFAIGFTAFLAQCGESGGLNVPTNFGGGPSRPPIGGGGGASAGTDVQRWLDEALRAFNADATLYVSLVVAALAVSLGAWAFVLWFSSRAKLMFVESVIWDRVDLGGQWNRAAELGFSLFKFRAALAAAGLLLIVLSIGAGVALALPELRAGQLLSPRAITGYVVAGSGLLLFGLPVAIVSLLLDDFVVPLMVSRNVRVSEAWHRCRVEVLTGNVGGVVLFYLLRALLGLGVAMITMMVTCLTCCLTAVPYLGTVLLLPVFVFYRAYGLCYMQERGITIFPPPPPAWAQYEQWRFPR
jgi:hypothetical protein